LTGDLELGTTQSGKKLYLDAEDRPTHMHVLGASGRGKSYFFEYLLRQDILNGNGLCLIDPHGTLYKHIVAWCAEHAHLRSWDKIILLDASDPSWTFGFNPLNFAGADTSYCVDSMVEAVAQVWGREDMSSMPLLKRVLRGVFHALAEKELTLVEALHLINEREEYQLLRDFLTRNLKDPVIQEQWQKWNVLPPRELREQFGSTTNRLMEFLSAEVVRAIIGQREWVIDFRKVMDEGGVVLVNLEPKGRLSDFNARLLGTLITNDLFLKAQGRPEGSRPFYLYIDECGRYLNESIQRMLDESRKRGLHVVLANQHLEQLRAAGKDVYSAITTDAQTKVIFGGLNTDDAETIVREVFLDLDLEESKQSLSRMVAAGQEKIVLKSGSRGRSSTTGWSHAMGASEMRSRHTGHGTSEGESVLAFEDGTESPTSTDTWGLQESEGEGEGQGLSEVWAESSSESISEMNGWTESFKTTYTDAVGGHFTLEEQRYKKVAWLKKQPRQLALLVRRDFSLIPFRVADVRKPDVSEGMVEHLIHERFTSIPYVTQRASALNSIKVRELELKQKALNTQAPDTSKDEEFDPYDNG
jgi:hypothetical protein